MTVSLPVTTVLVMMSSPYLTIHTLSSPVAKMTVFAGLISEPRQNVLSESVKR